MGLGTKMSSMMLRAALKVRMRAQFWTGDKNHLAKY
jgi:hypothetical protein